MCFPTHFWKAKNDAFLAQICGFTILQETKKKKKKPCEIVNLAERIQDQFTTEALAKLGNCNTHLNLKEIGRVP